MSDYGLNLASPVPDGGVAHILDTVNPYTSGLIASFRNQGSEQASIDYAGLLTVNSISTGAISPTGDINLQAGGEVIWASDTTLRRASAGVLETPDAMTIGGVLTLGDTLAMTGGTQDYTFGYEGDFLQVRASTSGLGASLELSANDGDGTDDVEFVIDAFGNPGVADFALLHIGYTAADSKYEIYSEAQGAGTLYPISIFTAGNADQILLATDGSVSMSGGLENTVIGAVTPAAATVTSLTATSAALGDDQLIGFGAGTDYWLVYNSAGTQFELRSNDIDGVGGNGIIWKVEDGSQGIEFQGAITGLSSLTLNGYLQGTTANGYLPLRGDSGATVGARLTNGGLLALGDTANANMTIGLTINQGANDDEILAFKSSDVAHGITNATETDTFGFFDKISATAGGMRVYGLSEATSSLRFLGAGATDDTTKTAAGRSYVEFYAAKKGGVGAGAAGANANLFAFIDGLGNTKLIIDQEGDYHYDGSDGGAFDEYDDITLTRAMAISTSNPAQIIRDRWDEHVRYNEDALVEAGILGAPVSKGGLVNGAQLQRLHTGAIWQLGKNQYEMAEVLSLLAAESNNPALAERARKLLPQA